MINKIVDGWVGQPDNLPVTQNLLLIGYIEPCRTVEKGTRIPCGSCLDNWEDNLSK